MSVPKQLFLSTYHSLGLKNKTYFIYGSGGCCDEIFDVINQYKLIPPVKILDKENALKDTYQVTSIDTISRQEIADHFIITASLAFHEEIVKRLTTKFDIPDDQVISLHTNNHSSLIWQQYSHLAKRIYERKNNSLICEYDKTKFHIGQLDTRLTNEAVALYASEKSMPLQYEDYQPNYLYNQSLTSEEIKKINSVQEFIVQNEVTQKLNQKIVNAIYNEIKEVIQSDWQVVNTRIWRSKPCKESEYGANKFHTDGFHQDIKKILVYLTPPSAESGTTTILLDNDETFEVNGNAGTWLLFDNSHLVHKGIINNKTKRLVIEFTIGRTTFNEASIKQGGSNARYPELPWTRAISSINLGGGTSFKAHGWVNYDSLKHPNVTQIEFNQHSRLPHDNGSINLIYSSHFFEHIDNLTFENLLAEANRVLSTNGDFVVKLPDFEKVISCYKQQDIEFFNKWHITPDILKLWQAQGVMDCIENRASMIFCGYWNSLYGDHFSHQHNYSSGAYHGPAHIPKEQVAKLLTTMSPRQISQQLKNYIIESTSHETICFNHQSAWSKKELIDVFKRFNFAVTASDFNTIKYYFSDIPDIEDSKEISMYLSFKKIAEQY